MLKAKDFKRYAREALAGRWLKAGVAALVAGFFGAAISTSMYTGSYNSSSETGSLSESISLLQGSDAAIIAGLMGIALILLLWGIVILVIGGATTLGYAKYNLNLVDDQEPKLKDIFSQYNRIGTGFGMQFFRGLFVFLWSLLFVIPGIIAKYSYDMTPFILCEHPEMTAREAITESKELMKGNKWRLFCLEFSFWGWYLLSVVVVWVATMVAFVPIFSFALDTNFYLYAAMIVVFFVLLIGYIIALGLTLSPYVTASIAVFYREISEGKYSQPQMEVEAVDYVYETVPEDSANDTVEYMES